MKMRLIKCECCDATFQNVSMLVNHMAVHMKKNTGIDDASLNTPSVLDTTTTTANDTGTASTCFTDVASVGCDGPSDGSSAHSPYYSSTFLKNNLQPLPLQPRKSISKRKTFTCEICSKCFSNGRLLSFHRRKHQAEKEEEMSAETGQQPQKSKSVLEAFANSDSEAENSESEEKPKASPNFLVDELLDSISQNPGSDEKNDTKTNQEIVDSDNKTKNENLDTNIKMESEPTTGDKELEDSVNPDQTCDETIANTCTLVERRTSPRKRKPIIPLPLIEDDLQIAYASGMVIDLKCIPCGKTFKRRSHLNRHLRIHTRVAEVICKFCKRTYDNQSMLAEHVMEQHQGSRAYQCSFCDKTFKTSSHLMRHRRIHTGIRPYKCSFCEKGFTDKTSLTSHLVTHTGIKDHKCKICEKAFARNTHLIRHMKLHERNEDSQLVECRYCRLLFPCQEKLKAHVTSHSKTCHVCNKAFRNLSRLTRHMSKHTRELAYKCQICAKVFSDTRDLATHISTHSDDKKYSCGFCPKTFSCQLHCEAHEKVHTGWQPFACQFCNKKFPDSGSLTEHLQCHSGPQLYACTQCPESFDHLDDLNRHLSTHEEEEKPYKCDRCDRTFSHATTLASHVRTHVEKKLFECQYCLKRFLTRAHQNRHLRVHADEIAATLHFCQVCQIEKNRRITFPNREALDTHMAEYHLEKLPSEKGNERNNSNSCNERTEMDNPSVESVDNRIDPSDTEAEKSASKRMITVASSADGSDSSLECLICHRQFARANNLSIHLRCHTGERPYSCTMCDMKFALSGTLRRHMRTHSGEKPFKCHICLRNFGASYSLKRHLRIHTTQSESGPEAGKLKTDDEYEEEDEDDDDDDNDDKNNNYMEGEKLTIKDVN